MKIRTPGVITKYDLDVTDTVLNAGTTLDREYGQTISEICSL